jgi:hypothetical protein
VWNGIGQVKIKIWKNLVSKTEAVTKPNNCTSIQTNTLRQSGLFVLLALLCLVVTRPVLADVVVIVNLDNPINQLSREQVVDIYMGRYNHFPDGHAVAPIDMGNPPINNRS